MSSSKMMSDLQSRINELNHTNQLLELELGRKDLEIDALRAEVRNLEGNLYQRPLRFDQVLAIVEAGSGK